ncbi:MAG: ATP-binding cassette domain-containing protein [Thermoflexales bacterium]|nr:ATP-binding cassette domain-containing protein [Thermoflexales bacterium]
MVEVQELSVCWNGQPALESVTLSIPMGSCFGLVGRYADGGALLLRVLATLAKPTRGDAWVGGHSVRTAPQQVRAQIGFASAVPIMDEDLSCAEYLTLFAACYRVPAFERAALVDDLLALAELTHWRDKPIKLLTPPMRKRLDLVRTLVNDPPVLLLEEPLALLDPRAQQELQGLLRSLSDLGKTVVLTLPNLALAQGLCTHVALFNAGRLEAVGTTEGVLAQHPPLRVILVRMLGDVSLALSQLQNARGVVAVETPSSAAPAQTLKILRVRFDGGYAEAKALLRQLQHSGIQLVSFEEER